ncbi:Glucosylceramidase, partial [Gryllus bimaculatus]
RCRESVAWRGVACAGAAAAAAGEGQGEGGCAERRFGYDSVACACSAARCDEPPGEPAGGLRPLQLLRVVSTRAGLRMQPFLDEYARNGLRFWGLTTQNEPSDGHLVNYGINRLGWSPERARDWIRDHLGPTLARRGYAHLNLMIHDDHRQLLPEWPQRTLNDSLTNSYVSGIAVHWYKDSNTSPELLTQTHDLFPDKFVLYTEACDGNFMSGGPSAINNWSSGWVDWNLALDTDGGPSYAHNEVDAAVIVNATADEFLKQPILYALTHFSRYVPRGSRQLPVSVAAPAPGADALFASAFATPDSRYVLSFHKTRSKNCLR